MHKKHITLCVTAVLFALLGTACTNTTAEAERVASEKRKLIVEEHNACGDALYACAESAQKASATCADALYDLYVYNSASDDIYTLFARSKATEDGDFASDFWTDVAQGQYTDLYGDYLARYAERKNIPLTDLKDCLLKWKTLSEEEQHALEGTEMYFGDFALTDATIVLHDFYGRTGNDVVYEIYKLQGVMTDSLVIITSWYDGRITGVVRLFNAA